MRENRTYGSVRGALSNERPYRNPNCAQANLAAAYALEGKTDELKSALAEARRANPDLTVKWLTDHAPNLPPLFEGLRKAGLPEQ